jgi:hypothetical protein
MKSKYFFALIFVSTSLFAQKSAFRFSDFELSTSLNNSKQFTYSLNYLGKHIIKESSIGFDLAKPLQKLVAFNLLSIDTSEVNTTWKPIWGEQDEIQNNYKEITYHLESINSPSILMDVQFRIFKDGIGFRYIFPKQNNLQHFIIKDELTEFHLSSDHKAFWIPGDFDTNEYMYNTTKLSEVNAFKAASREKDIAVTSLISNYSVQTPLMLKSEDGIYINIHEAALLNYPAMNLNLDKTNFTLTSKLVPDPVGNKAYLKAPFNTPWRTIIISNKAKNILASKTILNLNEPAKLEKTDWIKPQKYMGVWWEMHIGKATWQKEGGKHGATTENTKKYLDFAAAHHFDGVLVEGWNKGWEEWFGNWREDVFDFVSPYEDYDINYLSKYAKEKGIKLIMHHETSGAATSYERRFDTAFRFMQQHDINTLKTGYVGKIIPRGEHHDGQWMVNHYTRVAEKTAEYKIMLDAHEPVHSTGLHRTYPNWMSNEAARGTEFNNAPTLGIVPEHQTILPFTRLMGGPMDYTPGLFHFKLNQFDSSRKQVVKSTLTKQLALYVTMYSPLQMAADLPENYLKHMDAFQFIKDVPVDWSETKILDAEPGDFITIARRGKNSKNWFIGSITDENERISIINLDFLEKGKKYQAIIYKDAQGADYDQNPELYIIEKKIVDANTSLNIKMAKGGGFAISIFQN